MTIRVWTAAAVLMTVLLGIGGAMAASGTGNPSTGNPSTGNPGGAEAAFGSYFAAAARSAGSGARTEEIRQRRIAAALSPLVIQSIVQQPRQIPAIIAGLGAAAPHVAPGITQQAMNAFPGFADQIAHAAGPAGGTAAGRPGAGDTVWPVTRPPAGAALVNRTLRFDSIANRANAPAARAAAWAISAIASNPGAIDQTMSRAIPAAPGGESAVVEAVQAAYPGFALRIASAAARAPRGQLPLVGIPAIPAAPTAIARAPMAPLPAAPLPVAQSAPATRTPAASAPGTVSPIRQPAAVQQIVAQAAGPRPPATPGGLQPMDGVDENDLELNDPVEPMNRIIFAFNDTVDLVVFRPLAIAYDWIMPEPVIQAVRRFFLNLDAPVILINDLLQGDFADAGVTLGRFGINSTIGLLGLFDLAENFGMERHHADFGQTLHSYKVGAGPYVVLPLLGPASSRGAVGKIADTLFQPLTYLLSGGESLAVAATRGVTKREELLEPLDELRENSIDYYTGLKAAFWQARQVELRKGTQAGSGFGGDSRADKLFDAAN